MGVQPADMKRLTMWEFQALTDFWIETHKSESDVPGSRLSEDEKDELFEMVKASKMPLSHKKKATMNGAGHRTATPQAGG